MFGLPRDPVPKETKHEGGAGSFYGIKFHRCSSWITPIAPIEFVL
jgi:hypothetical protein